MIGKFIIVLSILMIVGLAQPVFAEEGTLKIIKNSNVDIPILFNVTNFGPSDYSKLYLIEVVSGTGMTCPMVVPPGNYSIVEWLGDGGFLVEVSCNGVTVDLDDGSTGIIVEVTDGSEVTCKFDNYINSTIYDSSLVEDYRFLVDVPHCDDSSGEETPKLKLVKEVLNDDGGNATADDWTLTATAIEDNGTNFSNLGGSGSFNPILANTTYTLSEEDGPADYLTNGEWTCEDQNMESVFVNNKNEVQLVYGQYVTCTIVNNDHIPFDSDCFSVHLNSNSQRIGGVVTVDPQIKQTRIWFVMNLFCETYPEIMTKVVYERLTPPPLGCEPICPIQLEETNLQEVQSNFPPLKQSNIGLKPEEIMPREGYTLLIHEKRTIPVSVTEKTAEILTKRQNSHWEYFFNP